MLILRLFTVDHKPVSQSFLLSGMHCGRHQVECHFAAGGREELTFGRWGYKRKTLRELAEFQAVRRCKDISLRVRAGS